MTRFLWAAAWGLIAVALIVVTNVLVTGNDPLGCRGNTSTQMAVGYRLPVQAPEVKFVQPECAGPRSEKEFELCQQQRAARAADESACVTRWQLWMGIFGLLGLIATVVYSARSARSAGEQVALSRQAMTYNERAYVAFEGARWNSHLGENTGQYFWRIRVTWRNAGNTPTRHLRIRVGARLSAQKIEDTEKLALADAAGFAGIPPDGAIFNSVIDVQAADLQRVKEGTMFLYVWGEATYRDVFDGTPLHVTRFFVQGVNVTGNPSQGWDQDDNPLHIDFAFLQRHNCADEECNTV